MAVITRIVESIFTKKIDAKNMIIFSFITMELGVIKIVFHAIEISLISMILNFAHDIDRDYDSVTFINSSSDTCHPKFVICLSREIVQDPSILQQNMKSITSRSKFK